MKPSGAFLHKRHSCIQLDGVFTQPGMLRWRVTGVQTCKQIVSPADNILV